ncbi:MAG: phosphatidylserine/phosphatidylglycerophosphate/cardiolipin synthase family protein [Candidatus Sericytochromatia bacterium]|nr:phosphatidylserine/phosphatidylglycerophosphate/cardiolipin synthase family protein [Candidatus Sericytochromatia bacterium]
MVVNAQTVSSATTAALTPLRRPAPPKVQPARMVGPLVSLDQVAPTLWSRSKGKAMDVVALDAWADKHTSVPASNGNSLETLIDGDAYFNALGAEIDKAQTSIAIVTHTFSDAPAPTAIVDKLIAKAKAGVKVAFIVDWFGTTKDGNPNNLQRLRDAGVHVAVVDKKVVAMRLFETTHSKITLIDGEVAFVGGHNLSGGGYAKHDVTIKARGPVLADVQQHFLSIWKTAGGGKLDLAPVNMQRTGGAKLRSLQSSAHVHDFRAMALKAIDSAKHEINTEQVYLTDEEFSDHLMAAARRGVRVRMIVPTVSDVSQAQAIHRANMDDWIAAGVEVYRYDKPMHTKALSVDGVWATIGSTNFTGRGMDSQFELSLASSDANVVAEWDRSLFEADRGVSKRMTLSEAYREKAGVGVKQIVTDWVMNTIVRPFV